MFNNPREFKNAFLERIEQTYSRDLAHTSTFEQYSILASMVRDAAMLNWHETRDAINKENGKQLYYFSMEFLMGRLLTNNLLNLGAYKVANEGLNDLGLDLAHLENMESDAGLGNGGLGRLAACFMDSIASLGYSGHGHCLRYNYGFFTQKFENGYQVEEPDMWLYKGNFWEIKKPDDAFDIKFYGKVAITLENGKNKFVQLDTETVRAVPYDMPIIGKDTLVTNTLRLWKSEASENYPKNKSFLEYEKETLAICDFLYPDDSSDHGKVLRLKQQYFFVSAGLQSIIKRHLRYFDNLDNFAEYNVMQINDTHPTLLIPEFMRILMDEYEYDWDSSWIIVTKSIAFTNHTILAEALEKWPIHLLQPLLPRVYMIIEEIHNRLVIELKENNIKQENIDKMMILKDNVVHMAHLAIVGSFSVNGVAALHTEILKEKEMKVFHEYYPAKFNNKTNGITQRRWLEYSNPELTELLKSYIGNDFLSSPVDGFKKLYDHIENEKLINEFKEVKLTKKKQLAAYIQEHEGVSLDPNSIFDVQVKRLHAYKRQLLNAIHIMYVYNRLKNDEEFRKNYVPHSFIFGAKAAPSYYFAKNVIHLIKCIANKVNNDEMTNNLLKVVFVTNYNVTYAEKIMPAADVSEQISLATKEASGTGNMKFMMNGALTIGTMDGANVEIHDLVKDENIVIFGLDKQGVYNMENYDCQQKMKDDHRITQIFEQLTTGFLSGKNDEFRTICDDIFNSNDEYYLFEDFDSYVKAHEKINELYKNEKIWYQKCLINIAESGFFSSDRTIEDYVKDIWHISKLKI